MKVSQIAKICKDMANLDLPQHCYDQAVYDYSSNKTATLLLSASNFVLEEIYSTYATAVERCVLTSCDHLLDTQGLSVSKVLSLADSQGNEVAFRYTERGLWVDVDGVYNVTYAKMPTAVSWNEEFCLPTPRITPRIFALGALGEYFSAIGDWQMAERYRRKFYDCLRIATRKTSTMKLPARRWW